VRCGGDGPYGEIRLSIWGWRGQREDLWYIIPAGGGGAGSYCAVSASGAMRGLTAVWHLLAGERRAVVDRIQGCAE
jgi:hypothetical protein